MIVKFTGKLIEKREQSVVLDNNGIAYEIFVPLSVLYRVDESLDESGQLSLVTYYYFQLGQSSGVPMLIGFLHEIERDFFLQFIKVSGIGPRGAIKALDKPIADITRAIDSSDVKFLKTLPGIGLQRAKEIVAKLQGKLGRYGLIQDSFEIQNPKSVVASDWQDEALSVLLQLQYNRNEAQNMIEKALDCTQSIESTEDLLNEIYKQKVTH